MHTYVHSHRCNVHKTRHCVRVISRSEPLHIRLRFGEAYAAADAADASAAETMCPHTLACHLPSLDLVVVVVVVVDVDDVVSFAKAVAPFRRRRRNNQNL